MSSEALDAIRRRNAAAVSGPWDTSRGTLSDYITQSRLDVLALLAEVARLEQERDIAKEQHANTLNRMLAERADLAAARAREQRLRIALEQIAASQLVRHGEVVDIARAALADQPAAALAEPCGVQFTAGAMSLACERPPGHLGEHACPSAVGSALAAADEPGEQ